MSLTPQQEAIVELHRDMQYHCSTEYEYIRDHRKRISELNNGYLKEKGYELKGIPCDGRCGKKHSSTLFMRRAEKLQPTTISKPAPTQEDIKMAQKLCEDFDRTYVAP